MSFPLRKTTTTAVTGNLDTLAAGTRTGAGSVPINQAQPHSLSAEVTVDAETNTITLYADWQVSDDDSTWKLVAPANNAANVILATGTGGADAAVTLVLEAPSSVYAWRYARVAIRNQVATGAAVDTYDVRYHYLKPSVV